MIKEVCFSTARPVAIGSFPEAEKSLLELFVATFSLTWVLSMQHNGRLCHGEPVVLVHLVGGYELRVVEDLVLAPGHVADAVLNLIL